MAELALVYVIKWMAYYFLLGMALHVVDRYFGVPFYRWYYNHGQKDPSDHMPPHVEMGLLYNRPFKRRRNWALIISALQSGYTVYQGEAFHAGAELIVLVFEAAFLLFGFRAGTWAYSFIRKQEGLTETMDRVGESIEQASVKDIASRWLLAPLTRLRETFARSPRPTITSAPEPVSEPKAEVPTPPSQRRERMSASDVLRLHEEGRKL